MIKVQVGLLSDQMPLLIYDRERALQRQLAPDEPGFNDIVRVVRSRGWNGLKAYMWAKREGADLRVYVRKLPDQEEHLKSW